MSLLPLILGFAASAWGATQQKNMLERLSDEMELASDEVRIGIKKGYREARQDIQKGYRTARSDITKGHRLATSTLIGGYTQAERDLNAGYRGAISEFRGGYRDAENALKEGFKDAQAELEDGNEAAATQILKGLGLATEEINKWADVAEDAMEWVVDFGREAIIPARAFMAEMTEAIMNPDSIWQSDVWNQYKSEVMDTMTNSASARQGVMSANTWTAIQDRLGKDAMTVRNNYISTLNMGRDSAMQQVGLGASASTFLSQLNQARGMNLANLYTGAYGQLGMNEQSLGQALSALQTGQGTNLANLATARGAGLSSLMTGRGTALGQLSVDEASALANLASGRGTNLANLASGRGTSLANLGVGKTTDLANLDLGLATQLANIQLAGMQENPWTNLGTAATTIGGKMFAKTYGIKDELAMEEGGEEGGEEGYVALDDIGGYDPNEVSRLANTGSTYAERV